MRIVSVELWAHWRLSDYGHDSGAVLAQALCHKLLDPGADWSERGRGQDGQLVTPGSGECADHRAEPGSGVARRARFRAARGLHGDCASEQRSNVAADQGGGHESEVAQDRVASADVGRIAERPTEAVALGEVVKRRAGIGYRDEVGTGGGGGDGVFGQASEELVEHVRLDCGAGLGRDEEEGASGINGVGHRPDA